VGGWCAVASFSLAGYRLRGVARSSAPGVAAVLFCLAGYALLVRGSCAVIGAASGTGDRATSLDDMAGLAKRRPTLAFALTILLLSQAGVPFTSGFMAKFYVIRAAGDSGSWWLAIVAMMAAVIAAFFYLRVVMSMWMRDPDPEATDGVPLPVLPAIGVGLMVVLTVAVGIAPQMLVRLANDAVALVIV